MRNSKVTRRAWTSLILFLAFLSFLTPLSCDSSLLSIPPDTVSVNLTAEPAVTAAYSSAQLAFTTNTAATVSVEYGTSTGALTLSVPRGSTAATEHSVTLSGLNASTVYYYRVVAYLGTARAFPGTEYSFTTAADPSTGLAVSGTPTVAPFATIATVAFNTTLGATYTLEFGTVSGTYTKATPLSATAALAHSAELTGLSPSTTYYYRLRLYYNGVFAANSIEYSFATNTNPSVLSMASGPVEVPDYDNLQISWTSNFACTHILEYGTVSGTYTGSTVQSASADTAHSVTVTGLSSATTYYYRIRQFWNTGDDFISIEYSEATLTEAAPTAAQKARGIWIVGGISGAAISSAVTALSLFDPVPSAGYPDGRWYTTELSTTDYIPVSFAGYAALNGRIYVIGGFDATGAVRNLVQVYDVAANDWLTPVITNMPTPRANIYASVINEKIYVLSGSQMSATTAWAGPTAPTGVCYEYTPGAPGTWVTKAGYTATNNTERFTYAYGNTLYSLGGRSAAAAVAAIVHDGFIPSLPTPAVTATTELAMATAPSIARTGIAGLVYQQSLYDDALIVIGGIGTVTNTTGGFINYSTGLAPTGAMSNLVLYLVYPFAAPAAWQQATFNFPGTGIAFGTAIVNNATGSDRIYHFGGTAALGTTAAGEVVVRWNSPPQPPAVWATDWTALTNAPMPTGRWGHGALTINQ